MVCLGACQFSVDVFYDIWSVFSTTMCSLLVDCGKLCGCKCGDLCWCEASKCRISVRFSDHCLIYTQKEYTQRQLHIYQQKRRYVLTFDNILYKEEYMLSWVGWLNPVSKGDFTFRSTMVRRRAFSLAIIDRNKHIIVQLGVCTNGHATSGVMPHFQIILEILRYWGAMAQLERARMPSLLVCKLGCEKMLLCGNGQCLIEKP